MINQFKGKYAFLSNFYTCPVEYKGKMYPSSEHAYQAMKSEAEWEQEEIRALSTPRAARKAGRQALYLREDWDEVKLGMKAARQELEVVEDAFSSRASGRT
jgi:predicted NAD-dependent protein-ADP-ribosyltransferase YbiA (DUF1768 family)